MRVREQTPSPGMMTYSHSPALLWLGDSRSNWSEVNTWRHGDIVVLLVGGVDDVTGGGGDGGGR